MLVEITRSRYPVVLLVATTGLLALAFLLDGVGAVVLSPGGLRAFEDLDTAAGWLAFVAAAAALGAAGVTAWGRLLTPGAPRRGAEAAQLLGAVAATLLIAIGYLVVAASGTHGSDAGSVVAAVGFGGWALLALAVAATRTMAEHPGGGLRQSHLWLAATAAVVLIAVATGLPTPDAGDAALAVAASVLFLLGVAGLGAALEAGRRRHHLAASAVRIVIVGLAALAVAYLAAAIADGFVYSATAGLTTLRVGLAIPAFLAAAAWGVMTYATFTRLAGLAPPAGRAASQPPAPAWTPPPPPPGTWDVPPAPASAPAGADAAAGEHCGEPLPAGATFCPRCGQPVGTSGLS